MDDQETKKMIQKMKKIKAIYHGYLSELDELKEKQRGVIKEHIKDVEERKIDEIRNKLKAE